MMSKDFPDTVIIVGAGIFGLSTSTTSTLQREVRYMGGNPPPPPWGIRGGLYLWRAR